GLERFLAGEVSPRYLIGWGIGAGVVGLLATAGFFTGLGSAIVGPERQPAVTANASAVTLGAWRSFVFVALAATILYLARQKQLRADLVGGLIACVMLMDLWSIEHLYWRFSPRATELYAADPTVEYIRRQPQPARVLPL